MEAAEPRSDRPATQASAEPIPHASSAHSRAEHGSSPRRHRQGRRGTAGDLGEVAHGLIEPACQCGPGSSPGDPVAVGVRPARRNGPDRSPLVDGRAGHGRLPVGEGEDAGQSPVLVLFLSRPPKSRQHLVRTLARGNVQPAAEYEEPIAGSGVGGVQVGPETGGKSLRRLGPSAGEDQHHRLDEQAADRVARPADIRQLILDGFDVTRQALFEDSVEPATLAEIRLKRRRTGRVQEVSGLPVVPGLVDLVGECGEVAGQVGIVAVGGGCPVPQYRPPGRHSSSRKQVQPFALRGWDVGYTAARTREWTTLSCRSTPA